MCFPVEVYDQEKPSQRKDDSVVPYNKDKLSLAPFGRILN